MSALLECVFLLPTTRGSDGEQHPEEVWEWVIQHVRRFGGGTRSQTLWFGWWDDPQGRTHRDLSYEFKVALPTPRLHELRDVLRLACDIFDQQCIYLSIAGMVEFVRR